MKNLKLYVNIPKYRRYEKTRNTNRIMKTIKKEVMQVQKKGTQVRRVKNQ